MIYIAIERIYSIKSHLSLMTGYQIIIIINRILQNEIKQRLFGNIFINISKMSKYTGHQWHINLNRPSANAITQNT